MYVYWSYISSSYKATKAARYIHTLIDYCLNPALKKSMDICIGCGIGICTGTIMITKVGMRGKESDETAENETGIVWVGSTTNYANRYCGLAHPCEIFIDKNTYSEIEDLEAWTKTSRIKGSKVFEGYTVSDYYLSLPKEITAEAVKAVVKRIILKLHLYKKFLLRHRKKLCCSLMRSAKNPQSYQLR